MSLLQCLPQTCISQTIKQGHLRANLNNVSERMEIFTAIELPPCGIR